MATKARAFDAPETSPRTVLDRIAVLGQERAGHASGAGAGGPAA